MDKLQLRIDDPCTESWNGMQSNHDARFCNACQKTVVDFTQMTDHQLVEWFSRKTSGADAGSTCGRLYNDQLNRVVAAAASHQKRPWLAVWRLLITGWLITGEARAQRKPALPPIVKTDQIQAATGEKEPFQGKVALSIPKTSPTDIIRGRVLDYDNGNPIQSATVAYGRSGVVTDRQGNFSISRKNIGDAHVLTISTIGYGTRVINIDNVTFNDTTPLIISLTPETQGYTLGFVAVATPVRKKIIPSILKDTLAAVGIGTRAFSAYPNPIARESDITISLRLNEPGTYSAQLFSAAGELMESMKIEGTPAQKSRTEKMYIPSTLTPGAYYLRLTHPSLKKSYTQQIIVE